MKSLNQILEGIELAVEQYETCQLGDANTQSEIARGLGSNLYFLVAHKIESHKEWIKAFAECKEKSDLKKEAKAHEQVPTYYTICQIQKAGENVLQIIRTTISANK